MIHFGSPQGSVPEEPKPKPRVMIHFGSQPEEAKDE